MPASLAAAAAPLPAAAAVCAWSHGLLVCTDQVNQRLLQPCGAVGQNHCCLLPAGSLPNARSLARLRAMHVHPYANIPPQIRAIVHLPEATLATAYAV
jgi:hypothetical protein